MWMKQTLVGPMVGSPDYHRVETAASMLFELVSEYEVSGGSGGLKNTRIT